MERGKLHSRKLSNFLLVLIIVTISAFRVSHLLGSLSDKERAVLAEAVGTNSMVGEKAQSESDKPGDDPDLATY